MTSSTKRRLLTSTAVIAALGLALTACSGNGDTGSKSGGTVNIGVVNTFNQPGISESATDMFIGAQLGAQWVAAHGGLYNGAKIAFNQQPENGSPALVASSVRTLLNNDVKLIIGPALSADVVASTPLIDQAGATMVTTAISATLTGAKPAGKNFWSIGVNDTQSEAAIAKLIAKQYPDTKTIDVVAYDNVQGHGTIPVIQAALKKEGLSPTIGKTFFVPLTTTNYQAQISALSQAASGSSNRILILETWGAGYTNFIKQAAPVKLFDSYDATMTNAMYYATAVALKGTAPKIWNSYSLCSASLFKNQMMTWLTQQMQSKYKRLPNDWTADGFNEVLYMAAGINKAKSTDPQKVNKALSTLSIDTPAGTVTMDPTTHQATRNVAVCQTEGDSSAPDGVKLVQGSVVDSSTLVTN